MKKKYADKLRVGDKVRLKKNLVVGRIYGDDCFLTGMIYSGELTIEHIAEKVDKVDKDKGYRMDNGYWYCRQMFKNPDTEWSKTSISDVLIESLLKDHFAIDRLMEDVKNAVKRFSIT